MCSSLKINKIEMELHDYALLIYEAKNNLGMAVQEFERRLVFSGFHGDAPQASITNDGEIILVYHGEEMSLSDIEYLMKHQGYIHKRDFIY